ncbi:hypothetical protein BDY21DRAFT_374254 [Lineolata rhizophorae]|uniref:Uncharacterized protein n=1 Tax=Lineolata rhizophorae TaxID=578093 RepID=A0A6A6NS91_9PEZI|nr:hypothetical protein BDY21DRAFT_374254 [Lineolata rhizophorae]
MLFAFIATLLGGSFISLVAGQDPNAPCYFPGGQWAEDFYPCDIYAYPTTLCCPSGWTCFDDALCIITDEAASNSSFPMGTTYRGTCTNPEWDNDVCGDFCLNNPVSDNGGALVQCSSNTFCCAPDIEDGACAYDLASIFDTISSNDGTTIYVNYFNCRFISANGHEDIKGKQLVFNDFQQSFHDYFGNSHRNGVK